VTLDQGATQIDFARGQRIKPPRTYPELCYRRLGYSRAVPD
jgi:hypothetical protein